MSSDRPTTITVTGVHARIGGTRVLDDASLHLAPGRLHAVVGPSGAGKSTLLRALTGTLPPGTETAGTAMLTTPTGAVDLLSATEDTFATVRGAVIGYVPQDAAASFTPVRTLRRQLAEILTRPAGRRRRLLPGHPHLTPATVAVHIEQLTLTVGLDPALLDRYPHQVSGGQIRRAALAAALAWHPPLLLADEPTRGLDPDSAALVGQMLRTTADAGHGILLVTHDHDLARRFADGVTVMDPTGPTTTGPVSEQLDPSPPRTGPGREARDVNPDHGTTAGLTLQGVSASYSGRRVLTGVDLTVRPGQVHGLTGPTGSGKSTLAAVATLMRAPDGGDVYLDGRRVTRLRGRELREARRRVAWLHQEPSQAFDPRHTLARSLTLPARLSGHPAPDLFALAESVGLSRDMLDRHPHQVSGGELQRAALARALTLDPDFLVADEITAMLDPATSRAVVRLLTERADTGTGILLISHDHDLIETYADTASVVPGPDSETVAPARRTV